MNTQHQGAVPPGPLSPPLDPRINQLDNGLSFLESINPSGAGLLRDAQRALQTHIHSNDNLGHFVYGVVIHAIPYVNWYKVQMGDGAGWIAACTLGGPGVPLGPREVCMIRPNDAVIVYMPRGLDYGMIIGVVPPLLIDGRIVCPDWVVQGGNSGLKREVAHKFPITSMADSGGVDDFSANRPMDQTSIERGWISPTGLAITIDDFLIQARVNEMCGLWMSWYDSWLRLAGVQLLIESAIHEESSGDDEGESFYFKGIAVYPWEALGLYAKNASFTKVNSDQDVQYNLPEAKVELEAPDTQPMYRYQEYGGYLGQGHFRTVCKPGLLTGIRQYAPEQQDEGLFRESIGLDGSYSLTSAKRIHIGKRCKIIVPKRISPIEDSGGDDGASNNYAFSGTPGCIKDIANTNIPGSISKASAVSDVIAYLVNWQALHPFHYHKLDFNTWQESDPSSFDRIQEALDFSQLGSLPFMNDPVAVPLYIDVRYGEVDYFERESFLVFHDDGTVQLGGGCGEHILLGGGDIEISTPGKVKILPGTDSIIMADQVMLRARQSIDISATNNDVSIKAEQNLRFLGGNSGTGGVLIESRSTGSLQNYTGVFGENVQSTGIVLKASNGVLGLLGQNIYLRTGGVGLGDGDILIDANQGNNIVEIYGSAFNVFFNEEITFNCGPIDENGTVNCVYYFDTNTAAFDSNLLVKSQIVNYGDDANIATLGGFTGIGDILTAGAVASGTGGFLGMVDSGYSNALKNDFAPIRRDAANLNPEAQTAFNQTVVQTYYQQDQLGNAALLPILQFSFRDGPNTDQYHSINLLWPESRWQQMARLGAGSGGTPWVEKAVTAQGEETYPYPGKTKLLEEPIFLELSELTMFNSEVGIDMPRPYVSPILASWEHTTMTEGYKLIR